MLLTASRHRARDSSAASMHDGFGNGEYPPRAYPLAVHGLDRDAVSLRCPQSGWRSTGFPVIVWRGCCPWN
eukprot:5100830-Prymnesium_polylepis.1